MNLAERMGGARYATSRVTAQGLGWCTTAARPLTMRHFCRKTSGNLPMRRIWSLKIAPDCPSGGA